jgi:glucan phosphoethanolaminetransferase (alkaline phosphatase superfamily)
VSVFKLRARSALTWSEEALVELDNLTRASEVDYADLFQRWYAHERLGPIGPIYFPTLLSSSFRVAAGLLIALEFLVVTLMTEFAFHVGLPVVLGLGAIVTISVTVAANAVVGAAILARLEAKPRQASSILLLQISILGVVVLLLIGGLLVLRTANPTMAQLSQYLLIALSLMMPALVALLQSAAKLYGWSRELSERWQALRELRNDLMVFHQDTEALLKQDDSQSPAPFG